MSRADRVVGRLGERGADLLLVTDLVNIRYLTGFTGSVACGRIIAFTCCHSASSRNAVT